MPILKTLPITCKNLSNQRNLPLFLSQGAHSHILLYKLQQGIQNMVIEIAEQTDSHLMNIFACKNTIA